MRPSAIPCGRWLLLGAAGACAAVLATAWFSENKPPKDSPGPVVVWTFEQVERGAIISTPVVTEECVYVAAIRDNALNPTGVVYCLDRRRGGVRWKFDDEGAMKHTYSTPCLADGRLYFGEGMHGNDVCKLYCLDAASGRKLWEFVTGGHIESSPCIADGAVFFGSGDDGIYCLDAQSGEKRWQFQGQWHVDVSPAVVKGRLYAGSGVSVLNRTTEIFCLDASNGQAVWRKTADLPVWGSPVVRDGQVFFGTGTGRLTMRAKPPERPAGELICADADTGRLHWAFPVEDALFARPVVDDEKVYFGSRDGFCYCLDRSDGRMDWRVNLGSPIVTRHGKIEGRLYVIASGGGIQCLEADSGRTLWTFDVAEHTQTWPQLLSSPIVVADRHDGSTHNLVFFGAELRNAGKSTAMLYCLRD